MAGITDSSNRWALIAKCATVLLFGLALFWSGLLVELPLYSAFVIYIISLAGLDWILARWQSPGRDALLVPALMVAVSSFLLGNSEATKPSDIAVDLPPTISFLKAPETTANFNLQLTLKASDDLALKAITAEINLSDEQADGIGFIGNGVFLFEPPLLKVNLPSTARKDFEQFSASSFTDHPWAGFYVDITLKAEDSGQNSASSEVMRIVLPERKFAKPLARSLAGLRQKLIVTPETAYDVAAEISDLLARSNELIGNSGLVLNLGSLKNKLNLAQTPDDVVELIPDFWSLILEVEQ